MIRKTAPFYMGGGIGTELEFDLQRFAEVSNPYTDELEEKLLISSFIKKALVDLSYYASHNIANYRTITTIPQENIEYLSSGLSASNCEYMFYNCKQLTSIPWNEFNIDTSQCTNMRYMFYNCRTLTSLDLSSMDTSQVTDMNDMFYYCSSLTNLDLSNFDTNQCTNMGYMFRDCRTLTSLNVSNFDTSKVTNMRRMFYNCSTLTSLDLSNFDTSHCTNMNAMFMNCYNLQKIICPNGFDLSSCTNIDYMFSGCALYNGKPLHFKNVPRDLDFSDIRGTEGVHYVIDSYKD